MEELRNLMFAALEKQGVLTDVRATLRASIFCALHEQEAKEICTPMSALTKLRGDEHAKLGMSLVREFLKSAGLQRTLSVFNHEIAIGTLETTAEVQPQLSSAEALVDQLEVLRTSADMGVLATSDLDRPEMEGLPLLVRLLHILATPQIALLPSEQEELRQFFEHHRMSPKSPLPEPVGHSQSLQPATPSPVSSVTEIINDEAAISSPENKDKKNESTIESERAEQQVVDGKVRDAREKEVCKLPAQELSVPMVSLEESSNNDVEQTREPNSTAMPSESSSLQAIPLSRSAMRRRQQEEEQQRQNYSQKEDNVTAGDTVDNTEGKEIREDASKPQKRGSVYISEEIQGTRTESMKLTERDFIRRISNENDDINDDVAMAEERSDLAQSNPRAVADDQEGREPQLETQAKPTADGGSMDLQGTPENRPCSSFRLDMSATHFNTCKCGFAKQDHDRQ